MTSEIETGKVQMNLSREARESPLSIFLLFTSDSVNLCAYVTPELPRVFNFMELDPFTFSYFKPEGKAPRVPNTWSNPCLLVSVPYQERASLVVLVLFHCKADRELFR